MTHLGIPTTIFSGFLGSGKTTIIGSLIDYLQARKQQVVYIKNEIGSENIDSQLLAGKDIVSKELLNGCICCTLVGPFMGAIDEVIASFKPDRIIIEASGAADPSAIALMVSGHPKLYRDGVISVIDVVNFTGFADLSITAKRQAQFTDLIVFNKVELASLEEKRAVVGYVRELNEYAPIVESPHGVLDPRVVFGISSKELEQGLEENLKQTADTDHSHLESDGIETFHLTNQGTLSSSAVHSFLSELPSAVFRVKALFTTDQAETLVAHRVGKRIDIMPFTTTTPLTKNDFVFIGFAISSLKDEIAQTFLALTAQ